MHKFTSVICDSERVDYEIANKVKRIVSIYNVIRVLSMVIPLYRIFKFGYSNFIRYKCKVHCSTIESKIKTLSKPA